MIQLHTEKNKKEVKGYRCRTSTSTVRSLVQCILVMNVRTKWIQVQNSVRTYKIKLLST